MATMNVLQVASVSFSLPYFIGEQFIHFREKGVNFTVACSPSNHFFEYAAAAGFNACPVDINRSISPVQDIKAIVRLCRIIKKEKISIVIGHSPKGALLSMIAAYISGVERRVYFRHGLVFQTASGFKRSLLIAIEKLTARLASQVVCVSPSIIRESDALGLNPPEKNILLGKGTCNGINTVRFSRAAQTRKALPGKLSANIHPGDRVIGYVGRLSNDKGIAQLMEAWKTIREEFHDIKLLLVGPFDERDQLPEALKAEILADPQIIFTDLVEDTAPYYPLMDIFVLPSFREGFPTVVLEASAMCVPVITTRKTGCVDSIIDGETGLFTELRPDDIASKLRYYLLNDELRISHGRHGRRFVEQNFKQEIVWDEIERQIFKL